jgi:1,5-anhydro-D-fructose reductase (1,5-anhydro-D-mannitol-forming)
MHCVRWGIIGCGDVTEVKSGPGFQKADGSALVAVMRRDGARARDYARRHGVPRAYDRADHLIADQEVDAVYVATPPSSHRDLAIRVAEAGKPCLVEKPMAATHAECIQMIDAFRERGVPLWVAYYRRALPRFLRVRDLLQSGAIGSVTSVHVEVTAPLMTGETIWRLDPAIAGGGLFFDLGSHCVDLIDFLCGPMTSVAGFALNTGGAYAVEDVTTAAFTSGNTIAGTGIWNFNAAGKTDVMTFVGSEGTLRTPIFSDTDVVVTRGTDNRVYDIRNPAHVHQPLIQSIVNELRGDGRCESTAESGARASSVLEQCVAGYYGTRRLSAAATARGGHAPGQG